jgi:hypothetical protein
MGRLHLSSSGFKKKSTSIPITKLETQGYLTNQLLPACRSMLLF